MTYIWVNEMEGSLRVKGIKNELEHTLYASIDHFFIIYY